MSDRRRNSITWVAPPTPEPRGTARRPICLVCAVGDCDTRACLRVACFHQCPNPRRHGSAATGDLAPPSSPTVRAKGPARGVVHPTPEINR